MATSKAIDFTDVKDSQRTGINAKHLPEGDYLARVWKVNDAEVKSGDDAGAFQWLFIIKLEDHPTAAYPYYCKLSANQLWKVRNLLQAAGINVPKKRVKVDPERVIGKMIAVTLQDDEYDGKMKSTIQAVFPPAEMEDSSDGADEAEDEEDEEEEEPTPAPKKKAKRKPEPEPEEDEDEDEEEEDEAEEEEEEEEEEEAPPPPKKKAKKATAKAAPAKKRRAKVDEDELEELDIEDI